MQFEQRRMQLWLGKYMRLRESQWQLLCNAIGHGHRLFLLFHFVCNPRFDWVLHRCFKWWRDCWYCPGLHFWTSLLVLFVLVFLLCGPQTTGSTSCCETGHYHARHRGELSCSSASTARDDGATGTARDDDANGTTTEQWYANGLCHSIPPRRSAVQHDDRSALPSTRICSSTTVFPPGLLSAAAARLFSATEHCGELWKGWPSWL
jgi:hypothetical protein